MLVRGIVVNLIIRACTGFMLVTGAHGKGLCVGSMLVLNQRKETILSCIQHFKESVGENVTETIVIDKDFTEWSVLEEVYANAKVLLCQWHAVCAVEKKLADKKLLLSADNQLLLKQLFEQALNATTEKDFKAAWNRLEQKSNSLNRKVTRYLRKNWHTCKDMWSSVGRKKFFTAGNTTTNRLEAIWHQLKLMLGITSSLDRCIIGEWKRW